MARRNPPAKWVLPVTVHPRDSVCVTIHVPNEQNYRAAFLGAILDLASGYKWQDDAAHTAKEVALVWRDIFDQLVFEECTASTSDADGDFDMTCLCEALRWNNGVLEGLCCGTWEIIGAVAGPVPNANNQPGPSAAPAVDTCADYFVTLNAADRWLLPFPVNGGDTITISEATGGWSDGTITWYCPSGQLYALGTCGTPSAPVGTDPIPTISHMRLIGQVGTTGGVGYFDAYSGLYTIPSGTVNQQLALQANDSSLSGDQGSISFKVTVCHKAAATWQSVYDFSLGQLLTTVYSCAGDCGNGCNSGPAGSFSSSKWNSAIYACSNQRWLLPQTPAFTSTFITTVTYQYNSNNAYSGSNGCNLLYHDGTGWHGLTAQALVAGTNNATFTVNQYADQLRVSLFDQTALTMVADVRKITINGQGTKPSQLI